MHPGRFAPAECSAYSRGEDVRGVRGGSAVGSAYSSEALLEVLSSNSNVYFTFSFLVFLNLFF